MVARPGSGGFFLSVVQTARRRRSPWPRAADMPASILLNIDLGGLIRPRPAKLGSSTSPGNNIQNLEGHRRSSLKLPAQPSYKLLHSVGQAVGAAQSDRYYYAQWQYPFGKRHISGPEIHCEVWYWAGVSRLNAKPAQGKIRRNAGEESSVAAGSQLPAVKPQYPGHTGHHLDIGQQLIPAGIAVAQPGCRR